MIYFVEDDAGIRELVLYTLNNTGLAAEGFADAETFWTALKKGSPRLVLLDIMLPGEDGLSVLKRLRKGPDTAQLPIILITAKDTEYDKVLGFENGADDYVSKPFGMMELLARIKRLLERTQSGSGEDSLYQIGELSLDRRKRRVRVRQDAVKLTLKEFELLNYLMKNKGIVLTREQLLNAVWGYDFAGESRTLDVHIRSLRGKLGDCGELVETVRGIGYRMGEI